MAIVSTTGSGGGSATYTTATGYIKYGLQQAQNMANPGHTHLTQGYIPSVQLPPPTGNLMQTYIMDASGTSFAIVIDSAYAGILAQINVAYQAYRHQGPIPMTIPSKQEMVDDIFSLEEIDQAEKIMEELGA